MLHLGKADPDTVVLEALIRSHLALGQLHAAVDRADQGDRLDGRGAGTGRAIIEANRLAQRRQDLLKAVKVPAGQGGNLERGGGAVRLCRICLA